MADKKKETSKQKSVDSQAAVEALEYLFAAGYVNKKKLYLANFTRGIFFSIGTIIGATIGIALILWVLSLFDTLPLIGDIFEAIQNTINNPPSP